VVERAVLEEQVSAFSLQLDLLTSRFRNSGFAHGGFAIRVSGFKRRAIDSMKQVSLL
jgi:hypothetical protein